ADPADTIRAWSSARASGADRPAVAALIGRLGEVGHADVAVATAAWATGGVAHAGAAGASLPTPATTARGAGRATGSPSLIGVGDTRVGGGIAAAVGTTGPVADAGPTQAGLAG